MPTGSADSTSTSRAPSRSRGEGSPVRNTSYGLHRHGYIVGKTLGSGAYAKVKAAHSLKLNKPVAIKIISKKAAPKDMVGKFLPREIETLKAMDHENVVKLHEVITSETEVYLALEYAEKGDLLDYINARKFLIEDKARKLFADLVRGIGACHARGIVHRDLKCENLLLDSQLRLKVSDFGFARMYDKGDLLETYCGSYAYAAPEVVLGDPYDGEAADLWSMGVVLYAMVSGRLPFKDNDVKTLLSEISSKLSFRPSISDECRSLIRGLLTFNPIERLTLEQTRHHPWMHPRPASDSSMSVVRKVKPAQPMPPIYEKNKTDRETAGEEKEATKEKVEGQSS